MVPSKTMEDHDVDPRKVEAFVTFLKWGGALLLAVAVGFGIYSFMDARNQKAQVEAFSLLFKADKLEEVAAKEAQSLSKTPTEVMRAWPEAKAGEYEAALKDVVAQKPGSTAALVARLRLGRWHVVRGKDAEAEKIYAELAETAGKQKQKLFQGMAFEGWAVSLERQQRYSDAEKVFDSALKMKDNPLKPLAYMGLARVSSVQGKKNEAKGAYEKVISEFPKSTFERKARVLLALEQPT